MNNTPSDPPKKPKKIIYPNQEEIYRKIITFVNSKLVDAVSEAYITGSVVGREFGKYETPYGEHGGSDIDVVVMIPKKDIPKSWKNLSTSKSWWALYSGGRIEINNIKHRLDLLVVHEGKEEHARKRMKELGWIIEKIK